MLSSIHPLGERSRNNRWAVTMAAFTLGTVVTAALIGATLGALGSSLDVPTIVVGIAIALAGLLDLMGVGAFGPKRQVNERWIDTYRGVIYGGGFGTQLGSGISTFVVTWGVYAVFFLEFSSGSGVRGAAIGATFGLARALRPLGSGWVDRPSRLTSLHRRLAGLARPMHLANVAILVSVGVVLGLGV